MVEMNLELSINMENLKQVEQALDQFPIELKEGMHRRMQQSANREEKILKSTTGFRDRTGRSRRSLFATATYNPIGIEIGSFLPHMVPLAYGHGTWLGGFWEEYIKGLAQRMPEDIKNMLERTIRAFMKKYADV